MRLGGFEERGNANLVELVNEPLDDRRRHEVDIDQFPLAPRHLDDLSPYNAPRVKRGAFADGNSVCGGAEEKEQKKRG